LFSPFHAADEGPINTHSFGNGLLAQLERQAKSTCICSKYFANIHPQDRKESRILALRVIIRGGRQRALAKL